MAEANVETTEAPKKSKKKVMIIGVVVMALGLGGGGFFYTSGKSKADAAACEALAKATSTTVAAKDSHAEKDSHATEDDHKTDTTAAAAAGLDCPEVKEEHGPIVRLLPITMNLSDGHVLKVGLALELAPEPEDEHLAAFVTAASAGGHGAKAPAEPSASPLSGSEAKALDTAIQYLGDSTYDALSEPGGRAKAKEELSAKIKAAYHDDVKKVYFTDFVMS